MNDVRAGLPRVRRASLRAVARVRGEPEPTSEACDAASWEGGLGEAYRSLRGERTEGAPATATKAPERRYRAPFAWVPLVAAGSFAATLALTPATALWETRGHAPPEVVLGVPNAPDSPLFRVLARVWALLVSPLAPPDAALTLLALACAAAFACAAFLLLHRALWGIGGGALSVLGGSSLGVILVLTSLAVWQPALPQAGAYLSTAALLTAGVWMVLRSRDRRTEPASRRWLLAAGYSVALGVTHPVAWLLPLACAAPFALRLRQERFSRLPAA